MTRKAKRKARKVKERAIKSKRILKLKRERKHYVPKKSSQLGMIELEMIE